jgi:hypothetical protein
MRGTGFMGGNVQAKHDGPDFHAEATLSQGQQGLTAEASYHQAVDRHVSAGGTVSAQLGALLPAPDVTGLGWGAFGAWHDGRREAFVLGRYDSQSGRATARYWRQAHKSLALGASVSTAVGGDWASTANVGGKWSLGGSEGGAPATLTAQLGTDLKAGFAWTKQNSAMVRGCGGYGGVAAAWCGGAAAAARVLSAIFSPLASGLPAPPPLCIALHCSPRTSPTCSSRRPSPACTTTATRSTSWACRSWRSTNGAAATCVCEHARAGRWGIA